MDRSTLKRWEPSPLFIVLAVATVIRLPAMLQLLWYDETYTAWISRLSWSAFGTEVLNDVHPPLYYLIVRAFISIIGSSEFALRLPSLVAGVLSVYLTWRLAHDVCGRGDLRLGERVPLVAAGLVAANPFSIYYSTEARMYALMQCAVLCVLVGIIEGRAWLIALGMIALTLSHNLSIIYLPWIGLFALAVSGWSFVPVMLLSCIPMLVWSPAALYQATHGQFQGSYWISTFVRNPIAKMLSEMSGIWFSAFRPEWTTRVGVLVSFSLLLFPATAAARSRNKWLWLFVMLTFGPPITAVLISLAWQPIILGRTFIGIVPVWCILIAWWIMLPRVWNWPRYVLVGTAAGLIAIVVLSVYHYKRAEDVSVAQEWFQEHATMSDVICHTSDSTLAQFRYYVPGRSEPLTDAAECNWLLDQRYITMPRETLAQADALIIARHAELVVHDEPNIVITTNIYRLH